MYLDTDVQSSDEYLGVPASIFDEYINHFDLASGYPLVSEDSVWKPGKLQQLNYMTWGNMLQALDIYRVEFEDDVVFNGMSEEVSEADYCMLLDHHGRMKICKPGSLMGLYPKVAKLYTYPNPEPASGVSAMLTNVLYRINQIYPG